MAQKKAVKKEKLKRLKAANDEALVTLARVQAVLVKALRTRERADKDHAIRRALDLLGGRAK